MNPATRLVRGRTVCRMDAAPEPTWMYLRRVRERTGRVAGRVRSSIRWSGYCDPVPSRVETGEAGETDSVLASQPWPVFLGKRITAIQKISRALRHRYASVRMIDNQLGTFLD